MRSGKAVQVFLVLMIAVLGAAGVYTAVMIRERQGTLENMSRYHVAHTAGQAVIELGRLHQAMMRLEHLQTPENLEAAKLRFDILRSRTALFDHSQPAAFLGDDPSRGQALADLKAALRTIEGVLADATLGAPVGASSTALTLLEDDVIELAAEANRYAAKLVHADQQDLARLHHRFSVLTFGLIVSGIALVVVLTWNNRLLTRAHQKLSQTTADLQRVAADLASANRAVAAANSGLREQNDLLVEKEDALKAQNGLFNAALNNISQGLCMFDDSMRAIVFNKQFERLFSVTCQVGSDSIAKSGCFPSLRDMAPDLGAELEENIRRNSPASFETECRDGRIIAVVQQPMPERDWLATFEDVTEQRRAQARIEYMARHDGLTDLPNRYAFRERIQEALAEATATGSMVAVMCLDLDRFKEVNDTLGHPAGDALLCAAAERLAGCVRDTDMVARFGGDEFAILQPGMQRFDEAERLAARLIEVMRQPFMLNGDLVYGTASLGIAIAPKHGHDPDVLLKNADLALYAAKADGRRTYRFFESEMNERLTNRHSMERDLRLALKSGQFDLNYQPVVHLRSGKITGFEALLRWTHPVRGSVPPSQFIPIAEAAGLITEIGRWVLQQACADAAQWPADLRVSVNLSAAQFTAGDIVEEIKATLSATGLSSKRVVLEITESLLLTDNRGTLDTLNRLKALGVDIAMDDFGTGYSSLSYLRNYPFDRIKIDRAFIRSAGREETSAAIVLTIVNLGHALGMTTVAEGVETEKDLELLLAAGCSEGQGYLFSPPVPRDKVLELVSAQSIRVRNVA